MAAEGIPVEVDTTKAQVFAGRLLTALNDAALCLMVSVGAFGPGILIDDHQSTLHFEQRR